MGQICLSGNKDKIESSIVIEGFINNNPNEENILFNKNKDPVIKELSSGKKNKTKNMKLSIVEEENYSDYSKLFTIKDMDIINSLIDEYFDKEKWDYGSEIFNYNSNNNNFSIKCNSKFEKDNNSNSNIQYYKTDINDINIDFETYINCFYNLSKEKVLKFDENIKDYEVIHRVDNNDSYLEIIYLKTKEILTLGGKSFLSLKIGKKINENTYLEIIKDLSSLNVASLSVKDIIKKYNDVNSKILFYGNYITYTDNMLKSNSINIVSPDSNLGLKFIKPIVKKFTINYYENIMKHIHLFKGNNNVNIEESNIIIGTSILNNKLNNKYLLSNYNCYDNNDIVIYNPTEDNNDESIIEEVEVNKLSPNKLDCKENETIPLKEFDHKSNINNEEKNTQNIIKKVDINNSNINELSLSLYNAIDNFNKDINNDIIN